MRTYLQSKDTHTASTLDQNGLAGQKRLQSIQRIPACQSRTGEGARFKRVQVGRGSDDAVLIKNTVLAQGSVDRTTETRRCCSGINGAVLVELVEEGNNLVALLELLDLGSDLDDFTGTVGAGDDREREREGVLSCLSRTN